MRGREERFRWRGGEERERRRGKEERRGEERKRVRVEKRRKGSKERSRGKRKPFSSTREFDLLFPGSYPAFEAAAVRRHGRNYLRLHHPLLYLLSFLPFSPPTRLIANCTIPPLTPHTITIHPSPPTTTPPRSISIPTITHALPHL